jgi:hypothetical protein
LRSYTFTYLDGDGQELFVRDVECADDNSAVNSAIIHKMPEAALVEIFCSARVVAKRRLDNLS